MPAICSRVHRKHILWGKVQGDEGRTGINLVLKSHFLRGFCRSFARNISWATKHDSIGYHLTLGGA